MKILFERGYAIDKDVDVVFNSANGFLLLGLGGAGRIRESSGLLDFEGKEEFSSLLSNVPKEVKNWYNKVYKKHHWALTQAQLSCLKLLFKKEGNEFRRGTAVLDENWSDKSNKKIIHVIAMSYRLKKHKSKRKKSSTYLLKKALRKAFSIASSLNVSSISIPVMCARDSYGLNPEKSFQTTMEVIKEFERSRLKKVIICFDNSTTEKYLEKIIK